MVFKSISFVMSIGIVWAQAEPSIIDTIYTLLPGHWQIKFDEILDSFKNKCEENDGPEASKKALRALRDFGYCLPSVYDLIKLVQEVKEAKPRGQVGEVFKKFCQNMPEFKVCFKEMTDAIKPCLSVDQQNNLKTDINVTDQLADFVCFKEGNRIALFISENGPECIQEKEPEILSCLKGTKMDSFQTKYLSPSRFLKFNYREKKCNRLQTCVVSALESCPAPNSARNAQLLFKLARKSTLCGVSIGSPDPNSASGLAVTSLSLSVIALALLV